MEENYFEQLYNIDVTEKIKTKNGLSYLSWSACWAEVKKKFHDATFKIYEQPISIAENYEARSVTREVNRPWFDDGKTGWVKTGVTINGIEHIEELPIMDHRNKPIPATDITSSDANKSIQRSLTKACARHGLGLYIYEGEDLPEDVKKAKKAQDEELKKTKDSLISLMGGLIEKGVEKNKLYNVISKHNGGNKNPTGIKDIEVAKKIIIEFENEFKENK